MIASTFERYALFQSRFGIECALINHFLIHRLTPVVLP
jgi:hypothetical protein